MVFEQAAIKVEKQKEFGELKGAIERAFQPERVERFLKKLQGRGLRVRDLDAVLKRRLLEQVDETLAGSGQRAEGVYQSLTLSDQAQMREFYLCRIEDVSQALRHKFQKTFRYY
jgi:hypothetical protein